MPEKQMSENSREEMNEIAYQADPFSERVRKRRQDMDCWVQPCHQSLIAFAIFTESLCLGSKKVRNVVSVLAGVQLCGKGMGFKGFSG